MNLFTTFASTPTVLVLGAGEHAGILYKEIADSARHAQGSILGFMPMAERDGVIPEYLILLGDEPLLQVSRRRRVTEIVVVPDHAAQKLPMQQLLNCKLSGIHLSDARGFLKSVHDGRYRRGRRRISLSKILRRIHQ